MWRADNEDAQRGRRGQNHQRPPSAAVRGLPQSGRRKDRDGSRQPDERRAAIEHARDFRPAQQAEPDASPNVVLRPLAFRGSQQLQQACREQERHRHIERRERRMQCRPKRHAQKRRRDEPQSLAARAAAQIVSQRDRRRPQRHIDCPEHDDRQQLKLGVPAQPIDQRDLRREHHQPDRVLHRRAVQIVGRAEVDFWKRRRARPRLALVAVIEPDLRPERHTPQQSRRPQHERGRQQARQMRVAACPFLGDRQQFAHSLTIATCRRSRRVAAIYSLDCPLKYVTMVVNLVMI